jgi:hypothetical protein
MKGGIAMQGAVESAGPVLGNNPKPSSKVY